MGILVAVLNILLTRSGREEQALMVTITGLVIVLVLVVQKISELFAQRASFVLTWSLRQRRSQPASARRSWPCC